MELPENETRWQRWEQLAAKARADVPPEIDVRQAVRAALLSDSFPSVPAAAPGIFAEIAHLLALPVARAAFAVCGLISATLLWAGVAALPEIAFGSDLLALLLIAPVSP
jgi:hypothetical protein